MVQESQIQEDNPEPYRVYELKPKTCKCSHSYDLLTYLLTYLILRRWQSAVKHRALLVGCGLVWSLCSWSMYLTVPACNVDKQPMGEIFGENVRGYITRECEVRERGGGGRMSG